MPTTVHALIFIAKRILHLFSLSIRVELYTPTLLADVSSYADPFFSYILQKNIAYKAHNTMIFYVKDQR